MIICCLHDCLGQPNVQVWTRVDEAVVCYVTYKYKRNFHFFNPLGEFCQEFFFLKILSLCLLL